MLNSELLFRIHSTENGPDCVRRFFDCFISIGMESGWQNFDDDPRFAPQGLLALPWTVV